jgi:small ligand-binding sensory domain FIST
MSAPTTTERSPAAASALSTHLDTRTAATEVAHALHDRVGGACDLVMVFATFHHTAALADAVDTIRKTISPRTVFGVSAEAVIGEGRECEQGPAISAIALHLPGVRLSPWISTPDQPLPLQDPSALAARVDVGPDLRAAILVGDPFSTPLTQILPALAAASPGRPLPIIGGMASGASQPGHNRLVLDDDVISAGTIGITVSGDVDVSYVVSQGANVISELDGRPPMELLQTLAMSADERDRDLLNRGLLVGCAIDPDKQHLGRGDFLVRNVLGLNQKDGSVAVGEVPQLGQRVQFHVRDAQTAGEDLQLLLDAQVLDDRPFAGLLFTCNGRGRRLFGESGHDIGVIQERLGPLPVAGFFAAGEIGPIGDRNFLHGHTACLALLRRRV